MNEIEARCPFSAWPDKYHDLGHDMMQGIIDAVSSRVVGLCPQEEFDNLSTSLVVVTLINFTTLPNKEGVRVEGLTSMTGLCSIDPDRVQQGINIARVYTDTLREAGLVGPMETEAGQKQMVGQGLDNVLSAILQLNINEPVPDGHPVAEMAEKMALARAKNKDKKVNKSMMVTMPGDAEINKGQDPKKPPVLTNWAAVQMVLGGDQAVNLLRTATKDKESPFVVSYYEVEKLLVGGKPEWQVVSTMEMGTLPENIVFMGHSGSSARN
jgi:hypothetical protein